MPIIGSGHSEDKKPDPNAQIGYVLSLSQFFNFKITQIILRILRLKLLDHFFLTYLHFPL